MVNLCNFLIVVYIHDINSYMITSGLWAVADPGFPIMGVGWIGGADRQRGHFKVAMHRTCSTNDGDKYDTDGHYSRFAV